MIRIEAHKSDVRAVAVSQMYIYSAGRDCKVSAWSVEDETLYHKSSTTVPDWAMALETFDGDNVAVGCRDGNIYLLHWDDPSVPSSQLATSKRVLSGHVAPVCSLHLSPCKSMLISGSWDGTARLWKIDTNNTNGDTSCLAVLRGHENNVCGLFLRSSPPLVVTGSAGLQVEGNLVGQQLRLWSSEHATASNASSSHDIVGSVWNVTKSITAHEAGIRALCLIGSQEVTSVSAAENVNVSEKPAFASAGNDATVRFFTINGNPIGSVARIPGDPIVLSISYIHESNNIAAADEKGQISLINASNGSIRCTVAASDHGNTIWSIAAAPHMKVKIAAGTSGGIAVYRWCSNGEWLFEGPYQPQRKRHELNGRLFDMVLPVEVESSSQGFLSLQLGINAGDDLNQVSQVFCRENGLDPEEYSPQIKHFVKANWVGLINA